MLKKVERFGMPGGLYIEYWGKSNIYIFLPEHKTRFVWFNSFTEAKQIGRYIKQTLASKLALALWELENAFER